MDDDQILFGCISIKLYKPCKTDFEIFQLQTWNPHEVNTIFIKYFNCVFLLL